MKILVVDDEPNICDSLSRTFSFHGYDVAVAHDGKEALDVIPREQPDLVILDVMMPEMSGIEVCSQLRASGDDRPILMLTARGEVSDRVAGLDAGADDYLSKPFELAELLARVRSLLRRTNNDTAKEAGSEELVFEDLRLNPESREVTRNGRYISLTRTEFALLQLLLANARKVLPRQQILEEVWGYDFPTSVNALEVYIGYLRRKTEENGESRLIHTVRGVGYVLRESN